LVHAIFPICVFFIGLCETQSVEYGWWSQYDQHPTDMMIAYHGYEDEDVDGFIAVPDCTRVGQYALIGVNEHVYYVRVFDCLSRHEDLGWWTRNNILGEIGYYIAKDAGVLDRGGVRAWIRWLGGEHVRARTQQTVARSERGAPKNARAIRERIAGTRRVAQQQYQHTFRGYCSLWNPVRTTSPMLYLGCDSDSGLRR
jgi:hypothetical protein